MSSFVRQDFRKIRVAAVQAESIFLDLDATTELACKMIADAAGQGAQLSLPLVIFAERFSSVEPVTRNLTRFVFSPTGQS